jgi:hypothetical protein
MKLISDSFKDGGIIPGEFAFAVIAPSSHVSLSSNRNPHLRWQDLPAGTKSLALICHDDKVPSRPDDVNQEGREIPADLPRVDFYHWTLFNLPPTLSEIAAGSQSHEVTPRGKGATVPGHLGPRVQHGINDYTAWFTGDAQMGGDYYGYDGPCPPWNDSLIHHYVFTLYALDVETLDVQGKPVGAAVLAALQGHVLDKTAIEGFYTLNPRLSK